MPAPHDPVPTLMIQFPANVPVIYIGTKKEFHVPGARLAQPWLLLSFCLLNESIFFF